MGKDKDGKKGLLENNLVRIGLVVGALALATYVGVDRNTNAVVGVKEDIAAHAEETNAAITNLKTDGCDPSQDNEKAIAVQSVQVEYFIRQQDHAEEKLDKLLTEIRELSGK